MIPEIGHFALIIALFIAFVQSIAPLYGATVKDRTLMAMARPAAYAQALFVTFSLLCLVMVFINNDYTVKYAAATSNSYLPIWYKVSAVWGGHEGSLLLWVATLSWWTAAVAKFSQSLPRDAVARVLGVMGLVSIGFLTFTLFTSNPFERSLPDFPVDGRDLNPLLQDIGLIIHPPMLYMGYVGFSVAFAFAIAGLLSGQLDSAWARWSRPWTTVAWCFLTVGIALGSWWAYYELGWGGWWFWDPVENASFMPWLAGTALLHSLAVTEKRGVFKAWTVWLAILAFSLSLLGTFLVRSGVLTSVHAFASDPSRGMFILVFLLLTIGGSLLLFAIRASALKGEGHYRLFSREVMLMGNNLILLVATTVVLLGTLFPLIADVLNMGKISVGPPYFNGLFIPLSFLLLIFLGLGPVVQWKKQNPDKVMGEIKRFALAAVILGVVVPLFIQGDFNVNLTLTMILCFWVLLFMGWDIWQKIKLHKQGYWAGWMRLSRSYKGMVIAHTGFIATIVGIAFTSLYSVEKDIRFEINDEALIGPYRFVFEDVVEVKGPNYTATRGIIAAYRDNDLVVRLTPEKRRYFVQKNVMTEAAIDPGFFRDIYVALGEPLPGGAWAVRVYFKPLVRWIWGGSLLMALGGVFAISDRRYRLAKKSNASVKSSALGSVA